MTQGVKKYYPIYKKKWSYSQQFICAIDNIDLKVKTGEIMGLVGESGCGKSTLTRLIMGLEKPNAGQIIFAGQKIVDLKPKKMRELRRQMQIIFQDSVTSLNPKLKIGNILAEPLIIHKYGNKTQIKKKVEKLLNDVGLKPEYVNRYPHQFSGGQRQRINIARALALKPRLIVADEPVSSLDVSIQAQILNLLLNLKKKFGLTYLLVAHDLIVVRHLSDRIAVMYQGKIVEIISSIIFTKESKHPYTKTLITSAFINNYYDDYTYPQLKHNEFSKNINQTLGCCFYNNCLERQTICKKYPPLLKKINQNHLCACHLY